ncbi:TIGR00366 family protein [Sporolactobacillus sp. THM19-2]|uniref:short-chain fatty acid transporter n=1 Tax=Sporolactobacillus sp. THM19-2 TaxID=2511171 RepID=UPI0013EDFB67|nr:TIGR00366 family protein [Sporolactobacillus sp. THM19-2]
MDHATRFFTKLMKRYLPDPFVFAIGLTLLTMLLAVVVEKQSPVSMINHWGSGFWSLLEFTTQMAVILAMGYVLASAPAVDRLLDKIVMRIKTPKTAVIIATVAGSIGCYLNWGFGLVIGGVIAKKLALHVKGIHYPLIIAAAYSGFTFYGLGLSASIPLLISTPGHPLEKAMGLVSLNDTIFAPPILITTGILLITLPLLNAILHPKKKSDIIEIDRSLHEKKHVEAGGEEHTPASRLNNSHLLSYTIGIAGLVYIFIYFFHGNALNLNIVNFIILFLGILLLGTPARYVSSLSQGIKTISGILLQFPFYAGIMAIMIGSGLVTTIAMVFVNLSSVESLPFWGLISSFVINFFVPSGGGHWVVQGPFMIDAAKALNASLSQTSMSVMLGCAWNDLIQPFWILPALALSKLRLKDIMGYLVIPMLWVGLVYAGVVLMWGYWF